MSYWHSIPVLHIGQKFCLHSRYVRTELVASTQIIFFFMLPLLSASPLFSPLKFPSGVSSFYSSCVYTSETVRAAKKRNYEKTEFLQFRWKLQRILLPNSNKPLLNICELKSFENHTAWPDLGNFLQGCQEIFLWYQNNFHVRFQVFVQSII